MTSNSLQILCRPFGARRMQIATSMRPIRRWTMRPSHDFTIAIYIDNCSLLGQAYHTAADSRQPIDSFSDSSAQSELCATIGCSQSIGNASDEANIYDSTQLITITETFFVTTAYFACNYIAPSQSLNSLDSRCIAWNWNSSATCVN